MTIYYENSYGEKIMLNKWPIMIQEPESIFGYAWGYSSNAKKRTVYGFNKQMIEKTVTLSIFAESKEDYEEIMNHILEVTEKDILENTQGKIYVNGMYMKCCVVASDIKEYEEDFYTCDKTIKVIGANGVWIDEKNFEFRYKNMQEDLSGRGYPYDYGYDYKASVGFCSQLVNEQFGYGDCIISIQGYARNPEIVIGENIYKLNYTIQTNETAYIDTYEKKIRLRKSNGMFENLFRYRNKDHYIFNKIAEGEQKYIGMEIMILMYF